MPELPEVEVTRLGISGKVIGAGVVEAVVRSGKLRFSVPENLSLLVAGETIRDVQRRGKYLIFSTARGSLLLHLGMTGHLRLVPVGTAPGPHDHFDLVLDNGLVVRMNDYRRFGSIAWSPGDPLQHPLLKKIGPEPLSDAFSAEYLFARSKGKKTALQRFLMDGAVVAGIGNIYAAESLFRTRLLPDVPAGALSLKECSLLAEAVRTTLSLSISAGVSTMDFCVAEEKLSYFPQQLYVYGREGEGCRECGTVIRRGRLGNRSTFFCPLCQRCMI